MLLVAESSLGKDEKAALAEIVDSGWITMGDRVHAFEQAFARAHRAADAVAVNSCTAWLHLVWAFRGIAAVCGNDGRSSRRGQNLDALHA